MDFPLRELHSAATDPERPMPQFTVNPRRRDPYKATRFEVVWEGRRIAGVIRVSGLRRVTRVVDYRDGDDPSVTRPAPGSTDYKPIILERAITHDTAFEEWANKVVSAGTAGTSLADFRRDVSIALLNEAGQAVIAYKLYGCWPSEYQALPDLDAHGDEVAVEQLVLQFDAWERDQEVQEPVEPSFSIDG